MESHETLITLLRTVECFSQLEEDVLVLLCGQLQKATFEAGDELCRQGEVGDRMFVIEKGRIAVIMQTPGGEEAEVTVLEPGQIAGEMSLFATGKRSATLRAKEAAEVWVLEHDAFQALLERCCPLANGLLASLSRHLSRSSSVLAKLMTRDLDRRFKVAVFDSKPYVETAFNEHNPYDYRFSYYPVRLSVDTAALATGAKVVCPFVNDCLDASVVAELSGLGVEMIALRCAGYNNVDLEACAEYGVDVTRVPAYSPYAVAEHAAALMMTLNRRVHRAHSRVREGNFSLNGLVGFDMHGKTVGVVGAGKIGQCLLHIMYGFGCRLLAYDKFPNAELKAKLGIEYVELDQLFSESDIISLHAPLLPATRYMINADAISRMKDGVMLINTSRGALVDTRALIDGLKTGRIGAAGLDVYEEESSYFFEDKSDEVMTDDVLARLTTFNNVVVTSHQAFLTREALGNIAETAVENIRAYQLGNRGESLPNRVTA